MNKTIILSLCLLFTLTNCQCPNGYQFASEEWKSFDLPEKGKYYQVALVCTSTGSYSTGVFKRDVSQVDCVQQNDGGYFVDPCYGDGLKICCVSTAEYDTSIAGFEDSTELTQENGQFTVSNENNWFGLIEYKSSRGDANYKFMQGGPWDCSNAEFGDPDVGYVKTCNLISTTNALFNSNYSTLIGVEHDSISTISYSQTGPIWVGYGTYDKWQANSIYLSNNNYKCNNDMFKDTYYGQVKQCYMYQSNYVSLSVPQGSWTNVASGQNINQQISWSTSYTNTVTQEDTLTVGISETISAGTEFSGVELTLSASYSSSTAYSDSISHDETMTCSASCSGNTVQYLWQWNIDGIMSTPEQISNGFRSQTCNYYCTDTAAAPKCAYAMKWDEDKSECVNDI